MDLAQKFNELKNLDIFEYLDFMKSCDISTRTGKKEHINMFIRYLRSYCFFRI